MSTPPPHDHGHPASADPSTTAGSADVGSPVGSDRGPGDEADDRFDETGDVRELGDIPAVEIITRAAVMLLSGAADKLGLGGDEHAAARLDLDEARRLIEALAGLLKAAEPNLGMHRQPLRDGLRSLQAAFREASPYPDAPGDGPGERTR